MKEKTVEATAWREPLTRDGNYYYRVQVNNVTGKSVDKVEKVFSEWKSSGYGWNVKTNYKVLIYTKSFRTEKEWVRWAKQFPYKLVEHNSKGKPKPIKLGLDSNKKTRKRKKC